MCIIKQMPEQFEKRKREIECVYVCVRGKCLHCTQKEGDVREKRFNDKIERKKKHRRKGKIKKRKVIMQNFSITIFVRAVISVSFDSKRW